MDMMGEISLTRLRGKGGEVELCSAAIHYSYYCLFFHIFPDSQSVFGGGDGDFSGSHFGFLKVGR